MLDIETPNGIVTLTGWDIAESLGITRDEVWARNPDGPPLNDPRWEYAAWAEAMNHLVEHPEDAAKVDALMTRHVGPTAAGSGEAFAQIAAMHGRRES